MKKLEGYYGRLKGLKALTSSVPYVLKDIVDDYNNIIKELSDLLDENLESFLIPDHFYYRSSGGKIMCKVDDYKSKLLQILSYLEYGYNIGQKVIEIGSIYNSISDEELKERVSDILTAPDNFDRVINQATLVLENRIREKSRNNDGLVGVRLVNTVLNTDLEKTKIKVSNNQEEHEGICHIIRGIMLSYRNPTHHFIIENYSREDALKFCAFVDLILHLIDEGEIVD